MIQDFKRVESRLQAVYSGHVAPVDSPGLLSHQVTAKVNYEISLNRTRNREGREEKHSQKETGLVISGHNQVR